MLTLKTYQEKALTVLAVFLQKCRRMPVQEAYHAVLAAQNRQSERYCAVFEDVPNVCLRIPTGGGKTLMAAHAIALAGKAMQDSEAPVALWLTPSDTIRGQTLDALSDVRHPYRQALARHFGDRVQVCDLESLQTVNPHDMGRMCIVVVATIQSFNVTNTAKRNVYSFFEELAPHFDNLPSHLCAGLELVTKEDLLGQPYLTEKDIGRVKYSVANWLYLHSPLIIVDEAHNNRTGRFFNTLGRLNPACIIELTATPVSGNNVLYHVSAQELKAEEMIKLPIVLAEHPDGWRACLRDAILMRDKLELSAQKEGDYVRPIALIQAEPKGGQAVVDVVRQYLIEEEKIPELQIAVATGSQKELDGINLFDPACPIRYVITVEALKEGWDCPFAYVLASLQSVNSAKDVEQLLGRVMRMPYAKMRQQDMLNRAYAHIVAENFAQAATSLKDRMVQNMGFERYEADLALMPLQGVFWRDGTDNSQSLPETVSPVIPDCYIQVSQVPDTLHWPHEVRQSVQIWPTTQGATLLVKGDIDSAVFSQVEVFVSDSQPEKSREAIRQQFNAHRVLRRSVCSPAQLGRSFSPVPQLCLNIEGFLEVVERETLCSLGDWNLLDRPIQLAGFGITESVNSFEIDVNGEKVIYRHVDAQQLRLNDVSSHVSEQDLVRWLDGKVRQPDISQAQMQAWLVKMVSHLIYERKFTLTALVRARFQLAHALEREIARLRQLAMAKGFQARLFDMAVAMHEQGRHYSFQYQPGQYPARNPYQGSYVFSKHFYPVIHDLREKTAGGRISEEFLCAQAIDAHAKVKYWVRNIERQEKFSFWLPTATDYFYPDFVAELHDGRILVVEYKGELYETNDDSREKRQVGEQWEKSSKGRCLFLFTVKEDEDGRTVFRQIADKLN